MSDAINPDHYKRLPAEAIEIIEAAIDKAPSNKDAYLHGQALKYLLRCWHKNGIEDLRKAKWYLDRLIDSFDESERQPAWTPKVGDWVKVTKPASRDGECVWLSPEMDKFDGATMRVCSLADLPNYVFVDGSDGYAFHFDWLEPAEQPKAPLNSDNIPEGYRKLKDSSIEPRQVGDLYWSVSKRRYVAIVLDHLPYANRDNWAACRRITEEVTGEVTGEVEPPDGWRWLKVGEVIRKVDRYFKDHEWHSYDLWVGAKITPSDRPSIRRNKFEVGEKVVHVDNKEPIPYEIDEYIYSKDAYIVKYKDGHYMYHWSKLAPYIEEQS